MCVCGGGAEPLFSVRASWMHFALKGPHSDPYPLPTLGRSWPPWPFGNSWCSRCSGEYLPPSLALSPGSRE